MAAFEDIARVDNVEALEDERGWLFEPIPDPGLRAGEILHVHAVQCAPRTVRGNHVHHLQTEAMCIVQGTFEVAVADVCSGESATQVVSHKDRIKITCPPGVAHAYKSVGEDVGVLLGYSSHSFDPDDIHPHHLLD